MAAWAALAKGVESSDEEHDWHECQEEPDHGAVWAHSAAAATDHGDAWAALAMEDDDDDDEVDAAVLLAVIMQPIAKIDERIVCISRTTPLCE